MKNTLIEAAAVLAFLLLSLSSCNSGPGRYQMIVTPGIDGEFVVQDPETYILDTHTGVYYFYEDKKVATIDLINKEFTVTGIKRADNE